MKHLLTSDQLQEMYGEKGMPFYNSAKTKEEILEKNLPSQFSWMKTAEPKLLNKILKSMEEYANRQLQLAGVSKSVKKCATCSVNVLVSDDCLSCDENYSEWK